MQPAIGRPPSGLDRSSPRLLARRPCSHGELLVQENGRFRWLEFSGGVVQSAMRLDAPAELVLPYTRAMSAFLLFVPTPERIWLLGLGGGSLLRFLMQATPAATLTTVDSDADVIAGAHAFFGVPPPTAGLEVLHGDAESLLRRPGPPVDALLVDLFGQGGMAPATRSPAFHRLCRERLTDGGVAALNIWVDDAEGFLAQVGEIRDAFDGRTLCLPVDGYRNIVVFAFGGEPGTTRLDALRERAKALREALGIDYPGMVARLARNNLTGGGELIL